MKRLLLLVAAVFCVSYGCRAEPRVFGDDRLKLPPEIKAQPGRITEIKAETAGKKVVWRVPPNVDHRICERGIICVAPAGRYPIICITAIGDEPVIAECLLIVEGTAPPPPDDPLKAELQALFAADNGPGKQADVAKLAAVFRQAATIASANADVRTAAQLADAVRSASRAILAPDVLQGIRQRIGVLIAAALPSNPDEVLTPETRKAASDLYSRIAAALDSIK